MHPYALQRRSYSIVHVRIACPNLHVNDAIWTQFGHSMMCKLHINSFRLYLLRFDPFLDMEDSSCDKFLDSKIWACAQATSLISLSARWQHGTELT